MSSNNNLLKECPNTPNCVCSMYKGKQFIKPIKFNGQFHTAVHTILETLPRTKLIKQNHHYAHITCKSKIFGFTDDLELQYSASDKLLHVRSASRTGTSDMGVNKRRVEHIRKLLRK